MMTHMPNPRTRFKLISDTYNGWLLVTPGELRTAGITAQDITPCSHRDVTGETIALDEDNDAHIFLRAWEAMLGRPVEIVDSAAHLKFVHTWPSFGTKSVPGIGQGV